jgi:hypothetical protein
LLDVLLCSYASFPFPSSFCKAQTSSLAAPSRVAWGLLKIDQGRSLLRVTTRMSEFLAPLSSTVVKLFPKEAGSHARAVSVHRDPRAHILAAIRLFTCQRALNNLRRRALRVRRHKLFPGRFRSEGTGIIAADPTLSIGWRENLPAPADRLFWFQLRLQFADEPDSAAVQAPRPSSTER